MDRPVVFVYGTLKRGGSNHDRMAGAEPLGPARVAAGHTLYSLGDYPGLVAEPGDADGVAGELWRVDEALLARLDEFEGVPEGLYARVPAPLAPPADRLRPPAWMYLYLGDVTGRARLGSAWPV